jgi:methionyl-tRNA formyltransferase
LNVHLSLLPKYRGAAPVAWAIMRGEKETGVTVMRVTPAVDAGPVLMQRSVEIGPDDTSGDLQKRLGLLAAPMAVEALDRVEDGTAVFAPQDESKATSAPALKKKRGFISWRRSALEIKNLVRAMNPWPLAYSFYRGPTGPTQRVIVLDVVPLPSAHQSFGASALTGATPGQVVRCDREGPAVAVGDGCVLIRRVKPAGGREMDGAAFVRGHHIEVGGRFVRDSNG